MVRSAVTTSSTLGSSSYAGPAVPREANEGSLVPYMGGTPTEETGQVIRFLRAGGLYENAEWGWRRNGDAVDQYRGQNDYRRIHSPNDPFDGGYGYGVATLASKALSRVLLYRYSTGSNYTIQYRNFSADYTDAWTVDSVSFERARSGGMALIAPVELKDGMLGMLVSTGSTTVADLDAYISSDGLNWTRVAKDILETWHGGNLAIYRLRADRSGDYIRVMIVDGTTGKLHTLVSSDRMASWTSLDESAVFGVGESCRNNGDANDFYQADIVGLDDAEGTFMLAAVENATAGTIRWYFASGADNWTLNTAWQMGTTNLERLTFCRTGPDIWLLETVDNGAAAAYWRGYRISRRDPTDVANRVQVGTAIGNYGGCQRYSPGWISAVEAGNTILILHALLDPDHVTPGTAVNQTAIQYLTGWSRQPMHRDEPKGVASAKLWDVYWNSACGAPVGSFSSPDTPLTSENNAATTSWATDHQTLEDSTPAGYQRYIYDTGAAPATNWADASVQCWTARVMKGGGTTADKIGVRIVAMAAAGTQTDTSVRMMQGGVAVYDNIASSLLYDAVVTVSQYVEWRWVQQLIGSDYKGELSYAQLGDYEWTSTGGLTLTTGPSGLTTHQAVKWGHLVGLAAGQTSEWRDWGIVEDDTYSQMGFQNPTDLRGHLASTHETYIADGMSAWFAGGGAYIGDLFDVDPLFGHGLDAMFMDSPSMDWRSPDDEEHTITFDAFSGGQRSMFDHDAGQIHGVADSQVVVQYNTSDAWGSPAAVETLSSVAHVGVTLDQVSAGGARIHNGADDYADGELAGLFMRLDSSSATVKLAGHRRAWVDADGVNDLGALGFAIGSTVTLFRSVAAATYSSANRYRWMRILFPASTTSTEDHRIGSMVFGRKREFDVPLSWSWTDSSQPNVDLHTTASRLRTAYKQGDPVRSISASLTGDASRWRESFRAIVDKMVGYSENVMGLCLDDAHPADSSLLVRYTGSDEHKNVIWDDSSGTWRQAGTMELLFEQEV